MNGIVRRKEFVEPIEGAQPEIARFLYGLELSRKRTNALLDTVDPASLDWLPDWALHSIGTLLYHIALVEADWLYVEILETPDEVSYDKLVKPLLPYPMRTGNALTPVTGRSLDEHRQVLNEVRRRLLDTFKAMSIGEFRRVRTLEETDVTPEWVLFHLTQHEAEHRSEIAVLQTQFKLLRN
ncbi:MAG: DinB family protein [Chloroflexota bacterium]